MLNCHLISEQLLCSGTKEPQEDWESDILCRTRFHSNHQLVNPLNPSIKLPILLSCHHTFLTDWSSGEKLLKYQENLTWVIMCSILMTFLTDKPLILQWEIWLRSLVGLKGLKTNNTANINKHDDIIEKLVLISFLVSVSFDFITYPFNLLRVPTVHGNLDSKIIKHGSKIKKIVICRLAFKWGENGHQQKMFCHPFLNWTLNNP